MHRQSLGSPVSKLHGHGGAKDDTLIVEEPKRNDDLYDDNDDEEYKASKPHRLSLSPPPPMPAKYVHFIPLLTLLCFLILYLCSHNPSQSDLAQFHGFKRPAKHIDEINDVDRFIDLQKGDVLAIRSLRNLQELEKRSPKSRSHRKHADF
ncbi:hypothetical protein I3843_11G096200 [Carya illinoinensis]|uniref:Uncharacterized protein n=1 Tax=Carya illinoinensis TaxID=32201 RepID=A0A8T1P4C7_CARIL|nr:uncharacterized protein LOC122282754 [Carya illinoinensis]KAG2680324.1 hypothetical protein I3760_11G095000 [Carya illinoinensis]KAG6636233.1 hypothetical protein CIPAW_11G097200 [Carya illinoinensis]KAG6687878.1 hypothetical protein I3842_11G096700 [Carya illinoinensis]KAG7955867.1 hypothetical protein I3843_11G096200 [Carya illinoinensis]